MNVIQRHPSSFRDPAGTIFNVGLRIVRGLTQEGADRYQQVRLSGFLDHLEKTKKIVVSTDFSHEVKNSPFIRHIEHEPIPFISYPYEWPFRLLKEAALLHLSIQIEALDAGISLLDASAYNIQFKSCHPVFIDILSFKPYEPGEYWTAHKQFCEQFLNPLLLNSMIGIPHNDWYRGSLEGIPTTYISKLMPYRSWLSPKALMHVLLPSRGQTKKSNNYQELKTQVDSIKFPKPAYRGFLTQLHKWISSLEPKKEKATLWEDYTKERLYKAEEIEQKKEFIANFISQTRPKQLWDLGCNDGEFSEIALKNGAEMVVGFDLDLGALDKAVSRAKHNQLNFLPLYQQVTNPSPGQGWLNSERCAISNRASPNAIIALAFIHHLALGHNIPLAEIVEWIVSTAPTGVIEFVQKDDPTVKQMLALKGDIFPNYTEDNFHRILSANARIIKIQKISNSGRLLYWYEK